MVDERYSVDAPLAGIQQELFSSHFLLLRRILAKSASHDFAGYEPRNQMERRVVLTLFRMEESRVTELAFALGSDVSQVSRAFAALRKAGLVERDRQRDPYLLTARGLAMAEILDAVALRREQELTEGLTPGEMFEMAGLMMSLHIHASQLLAEELAQVRSPDQAAEGSGPVIPRCPNLVQSMIINIANTILRDATAAFKRMTGVSSFEWRILVNVASRPSITFTGLVDHIDADKAQVSRTVDDLVTAKLLRRVKHKSDGQVRIDLTEQGLEAYRIMQDHALSRNGRLSAGLKKGQLVRLKSYLELLIGNAIKMNDRPGER